MKCTSTFREKAFDLNDAFSNLQKTLKKIIFEKYFFKNKFLKNYLFNPLSHVAILKITVD